MKKEWTACGRAAWLLIALGGCGSRNAGEQQTAQSICSLDSADAGISLDNPSDPEALARHNAVVLLARTISDDLFCSGTLITPTMVLTAAHCVEQSASQNQGDLVLVKVGAGAPYATYTTTNCWVNPDAFQAATPEAKKHCYAFASSDLYGAGYDHHDMALLELSSPVPASVARPMSLAVNETEGGPAHAYFESGQPVRIAGFGYMGYFNSNTCATYPPGRLTAADVVSNVDIESIVLNSRDNSALPGGNDSGSPLLWMRRTARQTQYPGDDREMVVGVAEAVVRNGDFYAYYSSTWSPSNASWLRGVLTDNSAHPNYWRGERDPADPQGFLDNCPDEPNPDQIDSDSDGRGDACDLCPHTDVAGGDSQLPDPQTNCNAAVEGQLHAPIWGDACDPSPCNTIAAINGPENAGHRIHCQRAGEELLSCTAGMSAVGMGYAPRVGAADPVAYPSPPPAPGSLVSPLRRCACWLPGFNGQPATRIPDEQCYTAMGSPCSQDGVANGDPTGFGWIVADLNIPTVSPAIPTGTVRDTLPGVTNLAAVLDYDLASSSLEAAQRWQTLGQRLVWDWGWSTFSSSNPFPDNFPLSQNSVPPAEPGTMVFWSRVQAPTAPSTQVEIDAQHLQDHYSERPIAAISPYQELVHVPQYFDLWWRYHSERWLQPSIASNPALLRSRAEYSSRFLVGVIPLSGDAPSGAENYFWQANLGNAPVVGLAVVRLNLREAQIVDVVATGGATADLPAISNMSYAMTQPDGLGWPDIFAFGGGLSGQVQNAFRYTTHTLDADHEAVYTWHSAPTIGAPPAREGGALAVSADGTRVYLIGGQGASGVALDDVWYYDTASQQWHVLSPDVAIPARMYCSLTLRDHHLYVGGGADASHTPLGDLLVIDGQTGHVEQYPGALPLRAMATLAFDAHGDGPLYSGGMDASGSRSDLWVLSLDRGAVKTYFAHDFAQDGLVPTEGFVVVGDYEHRLAWGVPGYSANGSSPLGTWFMSNLGLQAITPGDPGKDGGELGAASVASAGSESLTSGTTAEPTAQVITPGTSGIGPQ